MDSSNPFSGIKTCESYGELWGYAAFIIFMQVAVTVLLVFFEKFSGLRFNSYESMLPALAATAYISWKILKKAGADWRAALADWQNNAAGDIRKAFKYLAGYAGVLACFAAVLLAVYALTGSGVEKVLAPVSDSNSRGGELIRATAAASPLRLLLALFTLCAAAPLAEELFFRRIFYASLRKKMRFWPAALWSGAVFAVYHGAAAVVLFPAGVYLCWVYERERRLLVNILLHSLVNLGLLLFRLA